jgi:hypothetical protein
LNTTPNRLTREFHRLYGPTDAVPPGPPGGVRALVLEVARPAEWRPLAAVWKGVQADLGLPAPAIAANGDDGLQLWFSLAEPLDADQARRFLDALRLRYLADVPLHRVTLTAATVPPALPAQQPTDGRWSVFLAADLAPMFEESPWLDGSPTEEGQAELLGRLASIAAAPWAAAQAQLQAQQLQTQARPESVPAAPAKAAGAAPGPPPGSSAQTAAQDFLLTVMRDETAALALRVEAAKALLAGAPPR